MCVDTGALQVSLIKHQTLEEAATKKKKKRKYISEYRSKAVTHSLVR